MLKESLRTGSNETPVPIPMVRHQRSPKVGLEGYGTRNSAQTAETVAGFWWDPLPNENCWSKGVLCGILSVLTLNDPTKKRGLKIS